MLIGFSIAAPVGPIGVLCIRRALRYGRMTGLVSGLGAATADAIYGAVAAFGLTLLSGLLLRAELGFQLIGGAFLLYLGISTFRSKLTPFTPEDNTSPERLPLWVAYSSTLALTLTNPASVLAFLAIFGTLNVASGAGDALWVVIGVFTGSALWWLILSLGVGALAARLGSRFSAAVNWVAGAVLVAFGLWALALGISAVIG